MRTTAAAEWLRRRWADIVKAAVGEVGVWANGYSRGYIKADDGDFPADGPPDLIPLWDDEVEDSWCDWPHRDLYANIRHIHDTDFPGLTHEQRAQRLAEIEAGTWQGPPDREYIEYHFGSYAVFRVSKVELDLMNEGYDECIGTENERILEDGDHRIVVYMQ